MEIKLQTKALYNLLRSSWLDNSKLKVQPWQVEDYRSLSTKELFARLKKLDMPLTEDSFKQYAENCESPEELAECLWLDEEDLEGHDKAYLLIFELWRRLMPEKQTLSVFCDELDRLIELYDKGELADDDTLPTALIELEDIFDRSADEGGSAKESYQAVSEFCAHDLEGFIFDHIEDHIESDNTLYASELLDGFVRYMPKPKKFDVLKTKLLST
jgi:hypothetical protein